MRRFIKGLLAGTLLGALAGSAFRPSRKPQLMDLMNLPEAGEIKKRTGKIIKGMAKSMDKKMK